MTPLDNLEPRPESETPEELPLCNVLIVDDEPSNLLALEAILEPLENVRMVRAGSGVEALKHALKTEFCVLLLDVQMPEMDGFETARLLRMRKRTRDVPIIFLTAISKDASFVARGYDVGAVDYLCKPYDPDVLRTKVATFVELGRKSANMRARHEALRIGKQRELDDFKRWSERRYEDLANSVPQVVWTADASGVMTFHNQRWDELAESADPSFAAISHPDDLEAFTNGWNQAVRDETEWEAELRLGCRARGYRFHLVRATPRRDENGKVVAWIGTATDIHPRVKADRALRMLADASSCLSRPIDGSSAREGAGGIEQRDLEDVLNGALPVLGDAATLVFTDRPSGSRLRVALPGIDPALLDDPRFELGPSTVAYTGRAEVHLDLRAEDGTLSGRGAELLRFLGELGVRSYLCVPLLTRERILGTLTFVRFAGAAEPLAPADVDLASELARRIAVSVDNGRLHAATAQRRKELELANKSKDVFLATLSHELRTPLNAIVGWTDMMRKGSLEGEELARAIETIDRNAHALSNLVADLLDVSRIVTGSLKIESKLVSVGMLAEAAALAARPQCAARDIALDVDVPEEKLIVRGDPGRLRQVITNLLSNAIKFTPQGGAISVRVWSEGGRARLSVQDSGEGITPAFLPHVFERFRQAETGRAKGLGLGLAIVKHLVEEHGGVVKAASDGPGKGSTFTFSLPLAQEGDIAVEEESASSIPPVGEPQLQGVHVLIVEDDPDGNDLVCTILERYGAKVTSATTAAAALDVLETSPPNVLVSDIGLPDMDGLELIKTVRSRPALASIPAVALTAYASRQDAAKAMTAGFDAHVPKPVQPSTLGGVLTKLLARSAAA
jgi:PAS domain S-box-containing protein